MEHGHHGHGHTGFSHGDGGGIDFMEADFGEQQAAGGAWQLNNSKSRKKEYWDKWIATGSRAPIWPLVFLLACSLTIALFPILVEQYIQQPDVHDKIQSDMHAIAGQVAPQTAPQPPERSQSQSQAQYDGMQQYQGSSQYTAAPAQYGAPSQYAPQSGNETYNQTPGYDPRFGRPN